MKKLQKPEQSRFTLAEKSGAFFRGLIAGKPLVEVACAGLSRESDEAKLLGYARRISAARDSDAACRALRQGVNSESAESILASVIDNPDHAFAMLVGKRLISAKAEAVVAKKLASDDSGLQCYILLKLQTIHSTWAQEILARAVYEGGLSERAVELLLCGSMESAEAQKKLSGIVPDDGPTIAKILYRGRIARAAAIELSRRMPPVCVPLEELAPLEGVPAI